MRRVVVFPIVISLSIGVFSQTTDNVPQEVPELNELFDHLNENGYADENLKLGFIYSTGIGLKRPDPGRGLLHYTFSALSGNPLAQMAVAYRTHSGINVAEDCDAALAWYRRAARQVADKFKLIGSPAVQRIRLPDEAENVASGSSTLLDTNVFSYYKYLAETGDIQAKLALAQLYLTGGKGVPMDLKEAARYFTIAAEAGNAQAYAYLGRMYLEGTPATPQNNQTALNYFEKAAEKGNMIAQSGLGLMLLNGWGVTPNPNMAMKMFTLAADQASSDGQFHVAQMYYYGIAVEQNYKIAIKYFQLASQNGHVLALYNLAHMHAAGIGVTRSCSLATELLKNVAERGRWAELFLDAFAKYQAKEIDEAAIRYLFLAELGYEVAQTNFAFILDQDEGGRRLFPADQIHRRALMYWQRSANQEYAFSRVKLGDYSYYGFGTDVDFVAAANHYKIAANGHQNAQAFFNLAYMHEQGLGVTRDLHLAKRFYDLAAETATEAFFPVALALIKLRLLFFYDYFVESPISYLPSLKFLDDTLGPHWDLYAMSAFIGVIVLVVFNYFTNYYQADQNRRNPTYRIPTQNLNPQRRVENPTANAAQNNEQRIPPVQ
ncbi:hypothetical protein M3Y98_00132100 [Aphelenchoides besseyi]|nr:hypothetical protein M3Y98_00132100 [Aphelenchoides besseyi]KAI6199622.1 hypothetical protein M3Y96_00646500 [Aphelenchoides besseyi]